MNCKITRIGIGYDAHRLVQGCALILGGVKIPYEAGLLGHSDADAAVHAIMDAILGAAALGDIGTHFPDTKAEYKDVSSLVLLKKVGEIIKDKGWAVSNIDTVIVAQKPRISPYIGQMRSNIASALSICAEQVSVKATTTEGMGFEGRGEGISAQAVCCVVKI